MAFKSINPEATERADFLDRRSVVYMDGTRRLYGMDMSLLRAACFERDGCKCVQCGEGKLLYLGMDHITPRGSNGVDRDDRLENVQTLCGDCHRKKHVAVKWSAKVEA